MTETADQRYRAAFERLKAGIPQLLPHGSPVTQNNVAKEAGVDSSALKLSRHPALIREIQSFVEIAELQTTQKRARQATRRQARDDLKSRVVKLKQQRDMAQSQVMSAQRFVLELIQERDRLLARIDELLPPPVQLRR